MREINFSDYVAITEAKARYCRALDSKDWDSYADVFTEDFILDTEPAGGYKVHGRDEAVRLVRGFVELAKTSHQIHSPGIQFYGDSADVIWAMQDRVVWPSDKAKKMGNYGHTGYGEYHEHYVRCSDGRWRIKQSQLRRFHVDVHLNSPD